MVSCVVGDGHVHFIFSRSIFWYVLAYCLRVRTSSKSCFSRAFLTKYTSFFSTQKNRTLHILGRSRLSIWTTTDNAGVNTVIFLPRYTSRGLAQKRSGQFGRNTLTKGYKCWLCRERLEGSLAKISGSTGFQQRRKTGVGEGEVQWDKNCQE